MTSLIQHDLELLQEIHHLPFSGICLLGRNHNVDSDSDIYLIEQGFFAINFDTCPKRGGVVFYLSEDSEGITIDELPKDYETAEVGSRVMLDEHDDTTAEWCTVSLDDLINPIFIRGDEKIQTTHIILAADKKGQERIIGIMFEFSFGVIFGMQLFDDYRISFCFNSMCMEILKQANTHSGIKVLLIQGDSDERPHYSDVNWFDWIEKP